MEVPTVPDDRPRVLIADDHRALLDRIASMLSRDFRVIGAVTDGAQLVEAEATLHPDVLVVDISMPGMSGIEAAGRIRRRGSHVPFVCLTAHAEQEIVEAALQAGALGYVVKTCLADDLVPAIRAALDGRRFVSMALDSQPS
jgi:DNA-binding NarL/FixJ family response regulator